MRRRKETWRHDPFSEPHGDEHMFCRGVCPVCGECLTCGACICDDDEWLETLVAATRPHEEAHEPPTRRAA